jgi:probable phosphoglycerate mutase
LEQGLKMVLREDLNEIDFGDWSGRSFASLQCDPRWQRWNAQRATERPPNGEMIGEVQERAFACISRMAQDHPDAEVAAVSHGDVIKAVIAAVLGLPIEAHARFEISPASVSKIELWPDGCRLFCMNGVNEA